MVHSGIRPPSNQGVKKRSQEVFQQPAGSGRQHPSVPCIGVFCWNGVVLPTCLPANLPHPPCWSSCMIPISKWCSRTGWKSGSEHAGGLLQQTGSYDLQASRVDTIRGKPAPAEQRNPYTQAQAITSFEDVLRRGLEQKADEYVLFSMFDNKQSTQHRSTDYLLTRVLSHPSSRPGRFLLASPVLTAVDRFARIPLE